jgi:putative oxidoreductase
MVRMTPVTHQPVQSVVVKEAHDLHDAPGSVRAHLPNIALALLRVVAGLMFMQHGAQKLFGVLLPATQAWQGAPAIFSMMWFAGVIEIGAGLLIALGLFTRFAAFIAAGQMAVAYFKVHNPQGFFPIMNGGELAALYCFVFLVYAAVGSTRYSLDQFIRGTRKERVVRPRVVREEVPVHTTDVELPVSRTRTTREY